MRSIPRSRDQFVLVCQQLLTLLVVVAIIAPAANLVTLDIVAPPAARPSAGQVAGQVSGHMSGQVAGR